MISVIITATSIVTKSNICNGYGASIILFRTFVVIVLLTWYVSFLSRLGEIGSNWCPYPKEHTFSLKNYNNAFY